MPVAPRSPPCLGGWPHGHVVRGDGPVRVRNASASAKPNGSPVGRRSLQPTQRIAGSLRATGTGAVFGWPTMIGATGIHVAGMPSACFPSGVFR